MRTWVAGNFLRWGESLGWSQKWPGATFKSTLMRLALHLQVAQIRWQGDMRSKVEVGRKSSTEILPTHQSELQRNRHSTSTSLLLEIQGILLCLECLRHAWTWSPSSIRRLVRPERDVLRVVAESVATVTSLDAASKDPDIPFIIEDIERIESGLPPCILHSHPIEDAATVRHDPPAPSASSRRR